MERLVSSNSEAVSIDKPYYKSSGLPLLQQTWLLPSILLIQIYIINKLIPQLMVARKAFDLRPHMLVLNGLYFGTYGCGIAVFSYALSFCRDAWKCGLKPEGLYESGVIYAAYLMLIIKIFENVAFMIMALRKKPEQNPTSMAISNMYHLVLLYIGLRYQPIFMFMMEPYLEGCKSALRYSYFTLKSAKASNSFGWLKKLTYAFCILATAFNIYHQYYLLSSGCSVLPGLMYAIIFGSMVELVFTARNALTSYKSKTS